MTYRVIITDDALAAVEAFLDYIGITQQMPLTAPSPPGSPRRNDD